MRARQGWSLQAKARTCRRSPSGGSPSISKLARSRTRSRRRYGMQPEIMARLAARAGRTPSLKFARRNTIAAQARVLHTSPGVRLVSHDPPPTTCTVEHAHACPGTTRDGFVQANASDHMPNHRDHIDTLAQRDAAAARARIAHISRGVQLAWPSHTTCTAHTHTLATVSYQSNARSRHAKHRSRAAHHRPH